MSIQTDHCYKIVAEVGRMVGGRGTSLVNYVTFCITLALRIIKKIGVGGDSTSEIFYFIV